jgi:hypothetical protein
MSVYYFASNNYIKIDDSVSSLNIVNINLLRGLPILLILGSKLEMDIRVLGLSLVDDGGLGDLAQGLETAALVGRVLQDDISFAVLEVSEGDQDQITWINPYLYINKS